MIHVSPAALIFSALLILVLPLKWLISAFLAAAIHETAHIIFLLMSHGRIERITVGIGGAVIDGYLPDTHGQMLCILAGPAASLALCFFCRSFPELAVCGILQGVFNLLPVFPLDGGRLLRCVLEVHAPEKKETIERSLSVIVLLGGLFIWILLGSVDDIPLFTVLLLGLRRKTPCKQGRIRVQ